MCSTVVAPKTRARGAHQVLAPVVDIARDPRWGRIEETYGEDPYLVARMGVAAVRGFQGAGTRRIDPANRVMATLKHMTGHGQPESGINVGPASLGERTLRDMFLYPFEVAIKEARRAERDGVVQRSRRHALARQHLDAQRRAARRVGLRRRDRVRLVRRAAARSTCTTSPARQRGSRARAR